MKTQELYDRWAPFGFTPDGLESLRRAMSGTFEAHLADGAVLVAPNLVTNEGLDYLLTSGLTGGTQITSWRIALIKSNTPITAAMTYAVPVYTEIAGADVTESNRAIWTPGAVVSQLVDNVSNAGVYTSNATFTAFGLALVGGGGAPETIANVAGGGSLYAAGIFDVQRDLIATDVLQVIYTLGTQAVP